MNDFIVRTTKTSLYVKADPALISDLSFVLDKLLAMAKIMRNRAFVIESRQRRARNKELQSNVIEYDKKAVEIYRRYLMHLNNGCSGSASQALQAVKEEYRLKYWEAKYSVAQGKRLLKRRSKANQEKRQQPLFPGEL